jgi:hypothetical protein
VSSKQQAAGQRLRMDLGYAFFLPGTPGWLPIPIPMPVLGAPLPKIAAGSADVDCPVKLKFGVPERLLALEVVALLVLDPKLNPDIAGALAAIAPMLLLFIPNPPSALPLFNPKAPPALPLFIPKPLLALFFEPKPLLALLFEPKPLLALLLFIPNPPARLGAELALLFTLAVPKLNPLVAPGAMPPNPAGLAAALSGGNFELLKENNLPA